MLKAASVLWVIWGLFHVLGGIMVITLLNGEHPNGSLSSVPGVVNIDFMGQESPFAVIASLKQHGFNLAWIGVLVTIGAVYVWKRNKVAIFACAIVGGFADLGYFLYVDLAGYAETPGPEMTYIMGTAIILAFFVYFKSDKLKAFNSIK